MSLAMKIPSAFFIPEDDGFASTELTRGPWHMDFQHGGPPAALMARAIEHLAGEMAVIRFSVEFFRPIPLERLLVSTNLLRKGRNVQWVEATLSGDSAELARARAICMRQAAFDFRAVNPENGKPVGPEKLPSTEFPFFEGVIGYNRAMDLRFARGNFGSGDVAAWMRMRCALVTGEMPSPLQRVLVAADSGNGVSQVLDWDKWTFVNTDLTVYLHRLPVGEWMCLEAITIPDPSGFGLAKSRILDTEGPVGYGLQGLFVDRRKN